MFNYRPKSTIQEHLETITRRKTSQHVAYEGLKDLRTSTSFNSIMRVKTEGVPGPKIEKLETPQVPLKKRNTLNSGNSPNGRKLSSKNIFGIKKEVPEMVTFRDLDNDLDNLTNSFNPTGDNPHFEQNKVKTPFQNDTKRKFKGQLIFAPANSRISSNFNLNGELSS
jgi:hypothetical protein